MTRNLMALGISLVAMLALSSAVAATASALDLFTVPKSATKLEVTGGPHKLRFTGTSVESECSHVKIQATAFASVDSQIVTESIKYTGKTGAGETENPKCESKGLGDVTFDSNGCGYVLTGETNGKDKETTDATAWIQCPPGAQFTITTAIGCTIHVHEQTPTEGGVTYTNGIDPGGRKDITVTATLTGLTYSTSGFACSLAGLPAEGNTLDTNATYTIKAPEGIEYSEYSE
jgi:hypothetical protein